MKLTRVQTHRDPSLSPPWETISSDFPIGSSHDVEILRAWDVGYVGRLAHGDSWLPCFVTKSERSNSDEALVIGDAIVAIVVSLDAERRQINVTPKR